MIPVMAGVNSSVYQGTFFERLDYVCCEAVFDFYGE